jgi:hypothetical protein
MISGEDLRALSTGRIGEPFPLLLGPGSGRIMAADDAGLDLLVGGLRARLTWGRLNAAVARLAANFTLSVDELGGGHDAVGLVSLLAWLLPDELDVLPEKGLLVVHAPAGVPVHQYADMSGLVRRWPYHRRRPAR